MIFFSLLPTNYFVAPKITKANSLLQVQVFDEKFPFCIFLTEQTLQRKVHKPAFFLMASRGQILWFHI